MAEAESGTRKGLWPGFSRKQVPAVQKYPPPPFREAVCERLDDGVIASVVTEEEVGVRGGHSGLGVQDINFVIKAYQKPGRPMESVSVGWRETPPRQLSTAQTCSR
jgi:hypothetical protein